MHVKRVRVSISLTAGRFAGRRARGLRDGLCLTSAGARGKIETSAAARKGQGGASEGRSAVERSLRPPTIGTANSADQAADQARGAWGHERGGGIAAAAVQLAEQR